jgi:hypothetical protein
MPYLQVCNNFEGYLNKVIFYATLKMFHCS